MTQSSDGTHWRARKDGKIILQGQADEAGLYWVTFKRQKGGMKNDAPVAPRNPENREIPREKISKTQIVSDQTNLGGLEKFKME